MEIDIIVEKVELEWWPRLTSDAYKPAWLKLDFDKLKTDDDEDEEDDFDRVNFEIIICFLIITRSFNQRFFCYRITIRRCSVTISSVTIIVMNFNLSLFDNTFQFYVTEKPWLPDKQESTIGKVEAQFESTVLIKYPLYLCIE